MCLSEKGLQGWRYRVSIGSEIVDITRERMDVLAIVMATFKSCDSVFKRVKN